MVVPIPSPIVIFVRPQAPGNLGALSRVMANFGCFQLRIVGPYPAEPTLKSFSKMDWSMAKSGKEVLEEAQFFETLSESLYDIHLSIGTSGRLTNYERGYAREFFLPGEAFQSVKAQYESLDAATQFKWALVLGPEDDGLSQKEASYCQKLIRIPTLSDFASMNVAMAAGCLLYHWKVLNPSIENKNVIERGAFQDPESSKTSEAKRQRYASETEKEELLNYFMDLLSKTKFLKYPDEENVRARFRRALQSLHIPLGEVLFFFEALYHLKAWGTGHFQERNFLNLGANEGDKV